MPGGPTHAPHAAAAPRRTRQARRFPVTPEAHDRLGRALPVLALLAMVGVALLAWKLFPVLQGYVAFQDCTASGRTDCLPHEAPAN